jgi:hypothetical protein
MARKKCSFSLSQCHAGFMCARPHDKRVNSLYMHPECPHFTLGYEYWLSIPEEESIYFMFMKDAEDTPFCTDPLCWICHGIILSY